MNKKTKENVVFALQFIAMLATTSVIMVFIVAPLAKYIFPILSDFFERIPDFFERVSDYIAKIFSAINNWFDYWSSKQPEK